MRRRRLLVSVGLVVAFVGLVLVGLAAAGQRQPSFYRQADMAPGPDRARLSQEALAGYWRGTSVIDDPSWEVTFSADQINAFFQDEAYFNAGGDDNLPDGFHAPRVKIEDGRLRIGARYDSGPASTVMSLEVRLWKVPEELNTLALEIVSLHAGSLPLPTGMLLDRLSEAARRQNIDITWYRQDGHPVAIMRFQAHLSRPTFRFDRIELSAGKLTISGGSTDVVATPPVPRVVGP